MTLVEISGRRGAVGYARGRTTATRVRVAVLTVAVALVAVGCAAGGNDVGGGPDAAGFWLGLWHGFISPVTFLVSLFTDDVGIYEVHNTGAWYDFGFLVGVSAVFSGSARAGASGGRAASSRTRRRPD